MRAFGGRWIHSRTRLRWTEWRQKEIAHGCYGTVNEETLLGLTFAKAGGSTFEVLCIGAHCDDIEIGCGGTVLSLQRRYPQCKVHIFVLTSSPERRAEAVGSAK